MAIGVQQQQRRGTAAEWNTSDYVLAAGEFGVTTDTWIIKIGDGVNVWSNLPIAFEASYLPLGGKAADSELLDGIGSDGFYKLADATTTATADKLVKRTAEGRVKVADGVDIDDAVNQAQLLASNHLIVGRIETTAVTLVASDAGRAIIVNNSAYTPAIAVNVPPNASVAFPVGTTIDLITADKGPILITPGSGVTVYGPSLIYGAASSVRILKTAPDGWIVMNLCQSAGPVLLRRIKAGADNTVPGFTWTSLRLDGANPGDALFSNNADTLGTNEQWSSTNNTRAYCRRSGWYDIYSQVIFSTQATIGRYIIRFRVNGVDQYFGRGIPRGNNADIGPSVAALIPLNVNDYVEIAAYHEDSNSTTVVDIQHGSSFFQWNWLRPL
jgi:hypothetical protein